MGGRTINVGKDRDCPAVPIRREVAGQRISRGTPRNRIPPVVGDRDAAEAAVISLA
ncbi:MAG: hypothetical protein ACK4YM_09235 [Novosphingobium sp.]